jgi:imidazolonepropionase-like amidohydrolase
MDRRSPFDCHVLVALGLAAFAPSIVAQDLLVRSKTVAIAADSVVTDGAFLVRQGKVAFVGSDIPAEARTRAVVVDYGDATIVPGFVLPPTTLGRDRDLAEAALAFTPDLRAVEAFDPWQEELGKVKASGITSLFLSPSPRNIAGGIGAVVKPGADGGTVVTPELHLALSLAQVARNPERAPTSLMGAIELLRSAFTAAKSSAAAGPDVEVLRQVLAGSRTIAIHADSFAELAGALDLAKEFGFTPVLVGARDAEKLLSRITAQRAAIVLDTLRADQRLTQLRLPTVLAEAGVPFCFGGRPDQLRMSAVLAVRSGLDRKVALAALTRTAATLFDQQAHVGSLRQGCSADFVVFSGDPLDLTSAHIATWIDGVRVHGSSPGPGSGAPTQNPGAAAAAGAR